MLVCIRLTVRLLLALHACFATADQCCYAYEQAFLTEEYLAIVSEYAPLGDLADFIDSKRSETKQYSRGLPERQVRRLFQQLIMAVDFWCAPDDCVVLVQVLLQPVGCT